MNRGTNRTLDIAPLDIQLPAEYSKKMDLLNLTHAAHSAQAIPAPFAQNI
jgi:hypothetical protein